MKFLSWRKRKASDEHLKCACCGADMEGHLPAITFSAPGYWDDALSDQPGNTLDSDFCVIEGVGQFIRVALKVPIIDSDEPFQWGVWVSLSEKNFKRYQAVYGTKKEMKEEPYFGWFANQIPGYPDCTEIKTLVHLQGGGLRPLLELDHENPHPLCQEQHTGISLERAHELVRDLL